MKSVLCFLLCGASTCVLVAGCDDREVPDISGSYTCTFDMQPAQWCPDEQHEHIVRAQKLTIAQQLPGSGMTLETGEAKSKGFVTVGGEVFAKSELLSCPGCNTEHLYSVKLEAKLQGGELIDVVLEERRFGQLPEPVKSNDFLNTSGFESHPDDCRAAFRGTCVRE